MDNVRSHRNMVGCAIGIAIAGLAGWQAPVLFPAHHAGLSTKEQTYSSYLGLVMSPTRETSGWDRRGLWWALHHFCGEYHATASNVQPMVVSRTAGPGQYVAIPFMLGKDPHVQGGLFHDIPCYVVCLYGTDLARSRAPGPALPGASSATVPPIVYIHEKMLVIDATTGDILVNIGIP